MADRKARDVPLDDGLDDSLWDSPVKPGQSSKEAPEAGTRVSYEDDETRDAALRQELAGVRKVNEAIESVLQNLERAKANVKAVNHTVGAASTLLNTWTRILSQTEHNQRLILDPSWRGANQEQADVEAEAQARQQAALRREAEEQERKAEAARKAEEEERRRVAEATKQQKTGLRVRGRVNSRGVSSTAKPPSSAYGTTDSSISSVGRGSYATRRAASGIGRGTRGTRGRG
ncbi:uncharacterized protein HMPREF1541_00388 [Cyphellophora europaea CBS 101466]|uniref:DASH complex subunit DUO1 n=1 Tax=Cyphellophora europaea (strain CBS 101466) TaxID=1220924 RepID=W2SE61_CYPE1|nr:uncharacterized protein HMPREF1541_00388 [Cyphellophora europaea CBS 101466]ETN46204.1 hypothetical protein HMPREF1541_00388 [Cyphellophora europaea CBS 101466]